MIHVTHGDPPEFGDANDDMNIIGVLDVRSADHDLGAFADRIAALLAEDDAVIVDLSQHPDGGNHILLRTNRPVSEPSP